MAGIYDIGSLVRISATFSSSGAVTDPTAVVFKIKTGSGGTTTYTYGTDAALVKDSTGCYHVDWTTTVSGVHSYRFAGTGAVITAGESSFTVKDSQV